MANTSEIVLPESRKLADIIGNTGTNIANLMLYLAGAIAIGSLIGYGIMFITSGGDETKMTAAKKGIMYSVLGIIVITLSLVIVRFITKAVFV
ncbi:MAG: hypothetical protein Q7R60_00045 [bacterium]|nr:hypothetical protein [bacterium]